MASERRHDFATPFDPFFGATGEQREVVSAENDSIGLAPQLGHSRVAILSVE